MIPPLLLILVAAVLSGITEPGTNVPGLPESGMTELRVTPHETTLTGVAALDHSARSPEDIDIRLSVNAHVMPAGDSIRIDIDAVAVLDGRNEAFALARALGRSEPPRIGGPAHIARDSGVQSRPGDVVADAPVYRFGRSFTIVSTGPGTIEIGPVSVSWNETEFVSNDATILSAEPLEPGFDAMRSILPVRSESRHEDGSIVIRRRGTAFLVAEHALVTSYHVVMDAHRVSVRLPSGRQLGIDRGWVLDPDKDIALLYIDPDAIRGENMRPLPMAGGNLSRRATYTVGWRGGWLDSTVGLPLESVESEDSRRWVTSNPVRSGDSGGPLLTPDARVLGVITAGTVVQPRTEVLRREVCLVVDPRPLLEVLYAGLPPSPLSDLTSSTRLASNPFAVTFRAGAELAIQRARRLPAKSESVDALYRAIEQGETDEDVRLLYAAGMTARISGHDTMARRAFEKAIAVESDQPDASYMLGLMHLQAQSWQDAVQRFESASASPMYRHLALYGLARSLMGLHRFEEARILLDEIIDYDDRFAPALFDRGRIDIALGRPESASKAVVRLGAIDAYWGRRLKHIIDNPLLAPAPLLEQPRMPLPESPWAYPGQDAERRH